jgi:hypothetical protein
MKTKRSRILGGTTEVDFLTLKMNFADAKVPVFKVPFGGNGMVKYGSENKDNFGEHLLYLFNKSSKHNAIINGKVVYIYGNGLAPENADDAAGLAYLERANESQTWNEIAKKFILDTRVFGGMSLQIIPKIGGGFNVYNLPFLNVRTNEENSKFYYKKDWKNSLEKVQEFDAFSPNITDRPTIFYFKEYRPDNTIYPIPDYIAALNVIESDIELSKTILTKAKTGFSASKMINFFNGEPEEANKRANENRIKAKFTGAEGESVLITYNSDSSQAPQVLDLGSSDISKENFSSITNIITQDIFSGHSVTHPLLFGIQQEGKLGSSSELKIAFDIFKNTYANSRQDDAVNVVNMFASFNGVNSKFKLKDIEPVGLDLSPIDFKELIPKEWVIEKLGIDEKYFNIPQSVGAKQVTDAINGLSPLVANKVLESMSEDEIRSLVNLQPKNSVLDSNGVQVPVPPTNDILTNLTGRQRQNIAAIVRQYGQGKLTKEQAALMLKSGYAFTDSDVVAYLGIDADPLTPDATKIAMEAHDDNSIELMFNDYGVSQEGFNVIKKTSYMDDDSIDIQLAFDAAVALSDLETRIKDLLQTNPKLTNEELAQATLQPIDIIAAALASLVAKKAIEMVDGEVVKVLIKTPKFELPKIQIFYTYEKRADVEGASILPTSRPFCKKMVGLSENKMWSRKDIQNISQQLGYNVFLRAGGFWNNNGKVEYHCRHEWVANAVIKKENK